MNDYSPQSTAPTVSQMPSQTSAFPDLCNQHTTQNPAYVGPTAFFPQQFTGIPVGPNYSPTYQPSPATAFPVTTPPATTSPAATFPVPTTPIRNVPSGNLAPITPTTQPAPVTVESMQYINGFLRTQIGKKVTVDFLIGTNTLVDKTGTLLGVGANYILINEIETDDLLVCDFYTIKFVKVYY